MGGIRSILNHLALRLETVRQRGGAGKSRDDVLACGKRLSVPLVTLPLEEHGLPAIAIDGRSLIATNHEFGSAEVLFEQTRERIISWHGTLLSQTTPVTAGFIGSTLAGDTTTLGIEGSDYTASVLASILGASSLTRWTDVNGVYTADPRSDPDATRIERISMAEAIQRNEEGKMGMHRKALAPLASTNISVHIRSIDTPDQPGTQIVTRRRQSSS